MLWHDRRRICIKCTTVTTGYQVLHLPTSQTGPSWPPSRSGLTQQGGSSSHSVLTIPPYPHFPTSTGYTRSISNYLGLSLWLLLKISVLLIGTLYKSVLYRPFSKTQTAGRGQCGLGTRSLLPQIVGWWGFWDGKAELRDESGRRAWRGQRGEASVTCTTTCSSVLPSLESRMKMGLSGEKRFSHYFNHFTN